jgi:hypothetical protein
VIEATAPGYAPFTKTVSVPPDNGRALIEVPALVALEGGAAAVGATAQTSSGAGEPAAQGQPQDGGSAAADAGTHGASTAETVGIVLMGVGGVGLVVGTIFGVDAMQKDSDADELCGETTCASEKGANLSKDASDAALISTIGFVAGGGALVAGALVYFLGGEDTAAANVRLSPVAGGAELGYAGRF